MHPGQIFVITCPPFSYNSIKNTLTYGGECAPAALRKQTGKSLERQENENRACVESQHKPCAGLKAHLNPLLTPPSHPLAPTGQIHQICGHTQALCTRVSLSALNKPREGTPLKASVSALRNPFQHQDTTLLNTAS